MQLSPTCYVSVVFHITLKNELWEMARKRRKSWGWTRDTSEQKKRTEASMCTAFAGVHTIVHAICILYLQGSLERLTAPVYWEPARFCTHVLYNCRYVKNRHIRAARDFTWGIAPRKKYHPVTKITGRVTGRGWSHSTLSRPAVPQPTASIIYAHVCIWRFR